MNYYPHHIGDFNNATRHLTRIERSIYRDMIELYYDTEKPLLRDVKALCRKLVARTDEEVTAVEQVLNEYFTETEQGWFHDRCDSEIHAYQQNINKKSAAGKASAEARAAAKAASSPEQSQVNQGTSTGVEQVLNERATNQEPITNNYKPLKPKAGRASRLSADWAPTEADLEFCKTKRPDLSVPKVSEEFRDYWLGAGTPKADWAAVWRVWVTKQFQIQPRASPAKHEKFDPVTYMKNKREAHAKNERIIEFDAHGEPV